MGTEMEKDVQFEQKEDSKPVEIDIHKILIQLGIDVQKWPEEFNNRTNQSK